MSETRREENEPQEKNIGPRGLAEFKKFVEEYQNEFDPNGTEAPVPLKYAFYNKFYQQDINNIKYQDDPEIKKVVEEYNESIKELLGKETGPNIEFVRDEEDKWVAHNINGGFDHEADAGRFYLNLKPEKVAGFYEKVLHSLEKNGIRAQLKAPMKGTLRAFNKSDKMVIYFNADQEEEALEVLRKLYGDSQELFDDTGIPAFAAQVRNAEGLVMNGISFGEEPSDKDQSFGMLRSEILAEVYSQIRELKKRHPEADSDFSEYQKIFTKFCKSQYVKVDPQNPAFNLSRKKNKPFPIIRNMANN